ncbi:hypothetical protein [Opitutus terrae]|uniref:DsrE family protein n=1 Tax=Opitutus terrae (strain DSM 11246 / JCM 15787 / PB90-1) TaxID=452637 RepID=B1ZUL0_OPITP|nr:hypothetical protein [Opitutus terrae]ACB74053.1 conserved hypothetical protein [Opitutus terrae PB90-1]
MKNAIIILSDPRAGSDEATSRLLNALAFADECQRNADELEIVFAGTGTRWPQELAKPTHPAHTRYSALREHVRGASRSCAVRNDAVPGLEAVGVPLIADNLVPGSQGVASLRRYVADGWHVTTF